MPMDGEFRRKARALRFLCQDIGELRRGDHYAERLRLDLDRFAEANKEDQLRALEVALDESKQWPDLRKSFQDAFALFRQKKKGGTENRGPTVAPQTQSDRIKLNQIKSNQMNEWNQCWAARPLLDAGQVEHDRQNRAPAPR